MNTLPPGQAPASLQRFGLPRYAAARVQPPALATVTVTGAVRRPTQIALDDLLAPHRRRGQLSDLHCVTTWSARDLSWEGVLFRDVHEALVDRVGVAGTARWVTVSGLDGYRACLLLDDILGDDVLLADRLGDTPLDAAHGAPLRLVAPAQYGYKSVKHVCSLEYRDSYDAGSARWAGHPRGRVAREERSRYLPGRMWRSIWRHLLPKVRDLYTRDPVCT